MGEEFFHSTLLNKITTFIRNEFIKFWILQDLSSRLSLKKSDKIRKNTEKAINE